MNKDNEDNERDSQEILDIRNQEKFRNPTITPSGRKVSEAEERKKERLGNKVVFIY